MDAPETGRATGPHDADARDEQDTGPRDAEARDARARDDHASGAHGSGDNAPDAWEPPPEAEALLALIAERYGLDGTLERLPGDRDRNFLVRPGGAKGDPPVRAPVVVKVSADAEKDAWLDFETAVLAGLAKRPDVRMPEPLPSRDGDRVVRPDAGPLAGARLRVLDFLPGTPLAEVRPRSDALLEDLGAAVARLDRALATVTAAPPGRPDLEWALDRAPDVIGRALAAGVDRDGLLAAARESAVDALERASGLPRQLVHGDVNDHNVLMEEDAPRGAGAGSDAPRVSAFLDLGDAHVAPRIFDLAIAVAYVMLDEPDPIRAAERVAAGYHGEATLTPAEVDLVVPLARARLAVSVSMSARRREGRAAPDPYHLVSEAPAWAALAALARIPDAIATGRVRHACGLPPSPRRDPVMAWLEEHTVHPPVMVRDPARVGRLDLSVGSPLLDGRDTDDPEGFTERVFASMRRRGWDVGVGLWGEARGFYLTPAFAGLPSELPERRTIHLGVDLFAPAGTPVRAPLAGRVASVADHRDRLDYGPTVILEHDTPHGPIWTLYGHLERTSVESLTPGDPVAAGQVLARIGPYPENGDWPPHLHLQIILDRMDFGDTFPGVAAPREREVWKALSPDPGVLTGLEVPTAWQEPETESLTRRRAAVLGANLGLSYARPLHIVRGREAHLFDALGREYLDCVNNVAHVGHEHPRVVAAIRAQTGVLNTNTRYLHACLVEYAERLAALFPDPLSVCWFVNSGTEANELAVRLARAATGRRGVVVLEGGYHGHTGALIDVSHYKFSGPGGRGAPDWVGVAVRPDPYRGAHRIGGDGRGALGGAGGPALRGDGSLGDRYAGDVARALADLAAAGHPAAAFLHEALPSCAGQIVPPPGYLAAAYRAAREAGAVCIADEVQTGFGRVGSHMWAFELQGVVPDIVTLGKPMGNGHPVGAVITTREIAEAFDDGMEFFSTFGGNPVSARAGLAVLDVLRDEALPDHASHVGRILTEGLRALADRHEAVGDVRGAGLFLGVEIVSDREVRTPWPEETRRVVERMRERGVLLSVDGPDHDVIKIKPPLPFSRGDAERVVEGLDAVLAETPAPRPR